MPWSKYSSCILIYKSKQCSNQLAVEVQLGWECYGTGVTFVFIASLLQTTDGLQKIARKKSDYIWWYRC